jgi:hypothetical protein
MTVTMHHLRSSPVPLLLLACACSADMVDLGGVPETQEGGGGGLCAESSVLVGDVVVTDQQQLDELAGCEQITGNLYVLAFPGATLAPLGSLRSVGGSLELGADIVLHVDLEGLSGEELIGIQGRYDALLERGWLDSLEGLEELHSVTALTLRGISAPDLQPLRALQNIGQSNDGGLLTGWLAVQTTRSLRDLSGLENARGIGRVNIHGTQLESLDGLVLGESLESAIIQGSPRLRDIDALASVSRFGQISISGTAIEDLEGLAAMRHTSSFALSQNPALVDVSRIGQLEGADYILLRSNHSITSLPSLARLQWLEAIYIVDNVGLEEINLDPVKAWAGTFFEVGNNTRNFGLPAQRVEVQHNQSLRRLTLAGTLGFADIQFLTIAGNGALTQLDLPDLEKVDRLTINANATLSSVDIPSLKRVDTLEVTGNPALSEAAFDQVQTLEVMMHDNATP